MTGLDREEQPWAAFGVPEDLATEWEAFTARVAGPYRVVDAYPPGILGFFLGRQKMRLSARDGCRLALLDPRGREQGILDPNGEVGRHLTARGRRAVIAERADGTHLWVGFDHLVAVK